MFSSFKSLNEEPRYPITSIIFMLSSPPVNNASIMHVFDTLCDLQEYFPSSGLIKSSTRFSLQQSMQGTATSISNTTALI